MTNTIPVITIDGPSGVGKSTLSKIIAKELNWFLLESGKIYRFIALLALNKNIAIFEKNIIPFAEKFDCSLIHKENIDCFHEAIKCKIVSDTASHLATYPNVRKILLKKQRLFRSFPGLVAEGRDMGTVVFPDAIIKFFLYANLKIRVKRRMLELNKKSNVINFKELFVQMKNRDHRDQNRLISPLRTPKNAIILDSTNMSLSEVIKNLMQHIIKKVKL